MSSPASPAAALLSFPEIAHVVDTTSGIHMHAYDWGGTGPTLVLAHATGLHAHVWVPLVGHLRSSFRCIGVDLMGQGLSSLPTNGEHRWDGVAEGLVAVLEHFKLAGRGDVYGVGHSQGGYAVLEAELRRPGTFAAVFVHEPVVFPPMPGMQPGDPWPDNPMAVLTSRRRRTFPSTEAAIANFAKKPPFERCDRSVVQSYVYWGFRPTGVVGETGDAEIELVCSRETEAALFQGSVTDIFSRLHLLRCAVTYGLGEDTGSFGDIVPLAAAATPNGTLLRLPGRTHFGILEGIDEIAVCVRNALLSAADASARAADR